VPLFSNDPKWEQIISNGIRRTNNGENQSFEVIFDWCFEDIRRLCRGSLCFTDRQIHFENDLANEVLVSVWREIVDPCGPHFSSCDDLRNGILRTIKRLAIDRVKYLRRRKRMHSATHLDLCQILCFTKPNRTVVSDGAEVLEQQESWKMFLDSISSVDRQILEWKELDVPNQDIALRLGVCERSVRRRLRAMHSRWLSCTLM
jgi:DNA-directed RNA polymerase specialized sigma24 family protein